MRVGYHTLLAIMFCVQLAADPVATPPSADFSTGFKQLATLGVPEIDTTAIWSAAPQQAFRDDYRTRRIVQNLKGGCWLLTHPDGDDYSILPLGGLQTQPLTTQMKESGSPGLLGRLFGGGSKKTGPLAAADLAKDVQTLLHEIEREESSDPFESDENTPGRLLLFAMQIHQHGDPELANQLASAVFKTGRDPAKAIDSAVSLIADHPCEAAADTFFKSGDWADYHHSLTALVARFPRGWTSRNAVAMMLPQLEKQAAGATHPQPVLPGVELSATALVAVAGLDEAPPDILQVDQEQLRNLENLPEDERQQILAALEAARFVASSNWLLQAPETSESTHPFARITACGMDALPVLAAIVTDPFFTRFPNPQARSHYYLSSHLSEAERIRTTHSAMKRPVTRSEIAASLLRAVLPDPEDSLDEASPETMRDLALDYWKAQRGASREEIALVFLKEGSRNQIRTAADILASATDARIQKEFEAFILSSPTPLEHLQAARKYLATRKTAAKDFFEAYAKLVRSQMEDEDSEYDWEIRQAGGVEKLLKGLESLVAGKSPQVIAREIAMGKPEDAGTAIPALLQLMQGEPPEKQFHTLLEGAAAGDDPTIRGTFILIMFYVRGVTNENDREITAAETNVWRKLLDDRQALPTEIKSRVGTTETIGELAAGAFINSISYSSAKALATAAPLLRKSQEEVFMEHANARLAGNSTPPLPDASHVSAVRLREIVSQAGAKPTSEIHPFLETLTPDERAAWAKWWPEPGDIPLPESVQNLRNFVVDRPSYGVWGIPASEGTQLIDKGFVVSNGNVKSLIESLAADPAGSSRTLIWITNADFGPGLAAISNRLPLPKPGEPRTEGTPRPEDYLYDLISTMDEHPEATGSASMTLNGPREASIVWWFENGKPVSAGPDPLTTLGDALHSANAIQLRILSKADADAIRNAQSEHEDSFSE